MAKNQPEPARGIRPGKNTRKVKTMAKDSSGNPPSQPYGCQTDDLYMIHAVFRHAFGRAPALVQQAHSGESPYVNRVADHIHELLSALRNHHIHEDTLYWTLMEQRDPQCSEHTDRMKQDHADLEHDIVRLLEMLEGWRKQPDQKAALIQALRQLETDLKNHLDDEEQTAKPIAARLLTQAEWDKAAEVGLQETPTNRRMYQLGYMLQCAPSEELRQGFWQKLPFPVRMIYLTIGRRTFSKEWEALYREKPRQQA